MFSGQVCQCHDWIGCSETRTDSSHSVRALWTLPLERTRSELQFANSSSVHVLWTGLYSTRCSSRPSLATHSIIIAENVEVSVVGDLAISFSCLRRIFPAAERGICGKISTPPRSLLYATTCSARQPQEILSDNNCTHLTGVLSCTYLARQHYQCCQQLAAVTVKSR